MTEVRRTESVDEMMLWREEVIANVFGVHPDNGLLDANRQYYVNHATDGSHMAFVASADGTDCGCGAVCFHEELPSPDNPVGRCAYLMNIYVRKEFRDMGIAHQIVKRLIAEARKQGCDKIYLETTPEGLPVYSSLGFREMPDMMKLI